MHTTKLKPWESSNSALTLDQRVNDPASRQPIQDLGKHTTQNGTVAFFETKLPVAAFDFFVLQGNIFTNTYMFSCEL